MDATYRSAFTEQDPVIAKIIDCALVGKLIRTENMPIGALRAVLCKTCPTAEVHRLIGNIFLFLFKNSLMKRQFIERGPKNWMGSVMVFNTFGSISEYLLLNFSKCVFWVQVPGLANEFVTVSNARKIATLFPHCMEIKFVWGDKKVMSLIVEVGIASPFRPGFFQRLGPSAVKWIPFSYEYLPDLICSRCACLGHGSSNCTLSFYQVWNVHCKQPDGFPCLGPGRGLQAHPIIATCNPTLPLLESTTQSEDDAISDHRWAIFREIYQFHHRNWVFDWERAGLTSEQLDFVFADYGQDNVESDIISKWERAVLGETSGNDRLHFFRGLYEGRSDYDFHADSAAYLKYQAPILDLEPNKKLVHQAQRNQHVTRWAHLSSV